MLTRRFLLSSTALLATLPAAALAQAPDTDTGETRASSPDGVLSVEVRVNGEGRAEYSVSRLGRTIIAPSRLGFLLTDAPKLERNFTVTADAPTRHDETWEQPWGEQRFMRNRYTQLRVHLTERSAPNRRLDVVFRLYDDGLGFRYEFPEQTSLASVNIAAELTEFAIADAGTAWWIPAFEWNREEYLYNRTRIDAVRRQPNRKGAKTQRRQAVVDQPQLSYFASLRICGS